MTTAADRGMSVEECCEWMAAATSVFNGEVRSAESRDVRALRWHAREHLSAVRWRRSLARRSPQRERADRINLVMRTLCREAIRAIERERSGR